MWGLEHLLAFISLTHERIKRMETGHFIQQRLKFKMVDSDSEKVNLIFVNNCIKRSHWWCFGYVAGGGGSGGGSVYCRVGA